jgi:hypothetical protein
MARTQRSSSAVPGDPASVRADQPGGGAGAETSDARALGPRDLPGGARGRAGDLSRSPPHNDCALAHGRIPACVENRTRYTVIAGPRVVDGESGSRCETRRWAGWSLAVPREAVDGKDERRTVHLVRG